MKVFLHLHTWTSVSGIEIQIHANEDRTLRVALLRQRPQRHWSCVQQQRVVGKTCGTTVQKSMRKSVPVDAAVAKTLSPREFKATLTTNPSGSALDDFGLFGIAFDSGRPLLMLLAFSKRVSKICHHMHGSPQAVASCSSRKEITDVNCPRVTVANIDAATKPFFTVMASACLLLTLAMGITRGRRCSCEGGGWGVGDQRPRQTMRRWELRAIAVSGIVKNKHP